MNIVSYRRFAYITVHFIRETNLRLFLSGNYPTYLIPEFFLIDIFIHNLKPFVIKLLTVKPINKILVADLLRQILYKIVVG